MVSGLLRVWYKNKVMMISKIGFSAVLFAGGVFFLSNSATLADSGSSPFFTGRAAYVSVDAVCRTKGLRCNRDPLLKNRVVKNFSGDFMKLHAGSEYILIQGKVVRLEDKIILSNDALWAPPMILKYIKRLELKKPLGVRRIRKIAVDAGHGGQDFGAMSPEGFKEKDLTLEMATLLRDELQKHGIEVLMTRDKDVFVPLPERARLVNEKSADLFVSVHVNAATTPTMNGFEVYSLADASDDVAKESEKLAGRIAGEVEKSVTVAHKRVKAAGFYVLKWTDCPAVLVETAYLSNPEDKEKIKDSAYREKMMAAVARGILDYNEKKRD